MNRGLQEESLLEELATARKLTSSACEDLMQALECRHGARAASFLHMRVREKNYPNATRQEIEFKEAKYYQCLSTEDRIEYCADLMTRFPVGEVPTTLNERLREAKERRRQNERELKAAKTRLLECCLEQKSCSNL